LTATSAHLSGRSGLGIPSLPNTSTWRTKLHPPPFPALSAEDHQLRAAMAAKMHLLSLSTECTPIPTIAPANARERTGPTISNFVNAFKFARSSTEPALPFNKSFMCTESCSMIKVCLAFRGKIGEYTFTSLTSVKFSPVSTVSFPSLWKNAKISRNSRLCCHSLLVEMPSHSLRALSNTF
jgi:hypothetical protein